MPPIIHPKLGSTSSVAPKKFQLAMFTTFNNKLVMCKSIFTDTLQTSNIKSLITTKEAENAITDTKRLIHDCQREI